MKVVKGGVVHTSNQPAKLAAAVDQIQFDKVDPNVTVPAGSIGTMILVAPPPQIGHYNVGDKLYYSDSNHHNDSTFEVKANIGPSKYTVKLAG
ncbi:hypothetical protein [Pseudomonas sp. RIT-To-2]|uniref:hypothetical protein n=1 Tax=Pseudomonas sp. RIT-To-2 TaxID=3462541 RepID=UPI002413058D